MSLRDFGKTLATLFTVILVAPSAVQAQGGPATQSGNDPMTIYRQAGVSSEQESRIRQLAKDFEDQARVKAKMTMQLMQEMHQLSLELDPDEKSVVDKQAQINQITAEMANERVKLLLSIRKQLTTEQKQKLVALMKQGSSGGSAQ